MNESDTNAGGASRVAGADDEPPQPSGESERESGVTLQLEITDTTERLDDGQVAWLDMYGKAAIVEAVVGEGGAAGEHSVELTVVDDETMAALHQQHSGIPGTTDVLTFDLREAQAGPLDVEIVVCLDEARRMAEGGPVERETLLYLLHGVLHCLGYDDHDPNEFARMHTREDEILGAIGVGAVFGSSDPEGGR